MFNPRILLVSLFFICVLLQGAPSAFSEDTAEQTTTAKGPLPYVPESEIRFEPVVEGEEVVREFTVVNKGDAPLAIENVKPQCGCTSASHSSVIPPGEQGHVTLKFDTNGYGGTHFRKGAHVFTNAGKEPIYLLLSGKVNKFAEIEPKTIALKGKNTESISATLKITPSEQYPFSITKLRVDPFIQSKVKVSHEKQGNAYVITIENQLDKPGRYWGRLYIETDSPVKPELRLYIAGNIT